eukprot:symbB.v1.2.009094.t2/scaffold573.1/size222803/3
MASARMGQVYHHQVSLAKHPLLLQAQLTAHRLKEQLGDERTLVVTSPSLRCVQTASIVAMILQADLFVEPGLADWPMDSEMQVPKELRTLSFAPLWERPETWEMAVERYQITCEGLERVSSMEKHLVLCSHQAALEAIRPDGWTQGHCALCDLSMPKHDCSAWRDRFVFVATKGLGRTSGRQMFLSPKCASVTTRLCSAPGMDGMDVVGSFGNVVALQLDQAPLVLVRSKRERHLLLFLHDEQGHLLHLASGLVVSLCGTQLILSSDGVGWQDEEGELLSEGHRVVQRADNTLHLGHTDLDTMELDLELVPLSGGFGSKALEALSA